MKLYEQAKKQHDANKKQKKEEKKNERQKNKKPERLVKRAKTLFFDPSLSLRGLNYIIRKNNTIYYSLNLVVMAHPWTV